VNKNRVLLVALLCSTVTFLAVGSRAAGQSFTPHDLVGRWTSNPPDERGWFEFREDGSADIVSRGKSVAEQIGDANLVIRYSVDTTKRPMHLDVYFMKGEKEVARWKAALNAHSPWLITVRFPKPLEGDRPTDVPDLGSGDEVSTLRKTP
jgi:hypothetical protein